MPRPYAIPTQTTLDAAGAGRVTFTARFYLAVAHTRVSVDPAPGAEVVVAQPTALVYVGGQEFEGSYTGANDQSDTAYELQPGDTVECVWTGGDPGAAARLILRGIGG